MSSLKTVVNTIKSIVESNPIYNQFGDGNIWEVDGNSNISYPLTWIDYETTPHVINNHYVTVNMDIYFVDLVLKDESNELDIKSDTLESAIDFVKFLSSSKDLGFTVLNGSYVTQTFSERWNDQVAGNKLSISLTIKGAGSKCKNIYSV